MIIAVGEDKAWKIASHPPSHSPSMPFHDVVLENKYSFAVLFGQNLTRDTSEDLTSCSY